MSVEVRVNGQTFNLFKQLNLQTSLDNFSSEARIIVSESVNDSSFIKINDLIEIYIDGVQKLTGYAEKISDNESNSLHDISYRVRDQIIDIIDSSVPDNVKTLTGVTTFKELCQLVIDGLGMSIQVIDDVGASFDDDLKAAEIGKKAGDFLQEYARKVQVFLNTDGKGNILIRRPETTLTTLLLSVKNGRNNNIKSSSLNLDYSKRYNKYTVRSNPSLSSKKTAKPADLNQSGTAFDSEIRSTRIFEKIAESTMTAAECTRAAEEEANIRRLNSFSYRCVVAGYSANGELWEDGRFVKVQDDTKSISGKYVIKAVQYEYSNNGELTTLDLTLLDAYTVQANPGPATSRSSKVAGTYTIASGDTLSGVAARNNLTVAQIIAVNPQITNPDQLQSGQVINIPVKGGK